MKVDIVSVGEIAEIFGVTKQAVNNWQNRCEDFPTPLVRLSMGPIWYRKDIVKWGKANSKIQEV